MSYLWNNTDNLLTLKASGSDSILSINVGHEVVNVHLKDGKIDRVIHLLDGEETIIEENSSHSIVVGEDNIRRKVHHFLKPGGPSPFLRLGLTEHDGTGTWSSTPHPFEKKLEEGFEEVFFYILSGGSKRALQIGKGMWCRGDLVDDVWFVKDHSWSAIPMGFHPVVGEPGVHVSYIWAYLAKKKEWEKI